MYYLFDSIEDCSCAQTTSLLDAVVACYQGLRAFVEQPDKSMKETWFSKLLWRLKRARAV
jgi:hypothetical protein